MDLKLTKPINFIVGSINQVGQRRSAYNSKFTIRGVTCYADILVVKESSFLRTKFSAKTPHH